MTPSQPLGRWPCPVCGYLVFTGPPGTFEICPVCGWEDDNVQIQHPRMSGGPNRESIFEYQQRAASWKPADALTRDPGWRPLGPREAPLPGGQASVVDYSLDYYQGHEPYYWRLRSAQPAQRRDFSEAQVAWERGHVKEARALLQPYADANDIDALLLLGTLLTMSGTPTDFREGAAILRRAAELGSSHAAHNLGVSLMVSGPDGEPDERAAQEFLAMATEMGFEATVASDPLWWKHSK